MKHSEHSHGLLVLAGPTGSGKTAVAESIARRIKGVLISCDSMQVYRGMPILTQAPTSRSQKTQLASFLSPSREYSAARFRADAERLVRSALRAGRTPIVVGGTGLYLRALMDGLFESAPGEKSSDEALRKKLLAQQQRHGGSWLHERLRVVDPAAAGRIHPNDWRRLIRALEVYTLTGQPLSARQPIRQGLRTQVPHRLFLIDRERQDLYARIDSRVGRMLKDGLVEEVKKLRKRRLSRTAAMALGLREIGEYLDGRVTLAQAVEELKKNTRRYAKRQLSWFRHEKGMEPVPVSPRQKVSQTAAAVLRKWKSGS